MVSRDDDEPVGAPTPSDPDNPPDPDLPSDAAAQPSPDPGPQPPEPDRPEPDRPEATDEERWAGIVADLGSLGALRLPYSPAAGRSGRDWHGTEQIAAAARAGAEAEHFVPPAAPPVLGGDPLLTMAWFAVAGMPVLWLVVLIVWTSAPRVVVHASAAVFVAGLAVLFWRMPHRRDPDDDDTGAVV
jgi:hypothetical protein